MYILLFNWSIYSILFYKVTSLSEPYGDCEDTMPVSNCKLQCKTKQVVETCGCHAAYMKPEVTDESKFCIIST